MAAHSSAKRLEILVPTRYEQMGGKLGDNHPGELAVGEW